MILREISSELELLLNEFPVVTILGPRQSGKTTLAKQQGNHWIYRNLESPETRKLALDDPKTFLAQLHGKPTIIDEIQRAPELLSYIQLIVDEEDVPGQFILTGSHQLELRASITQSLAGRTAILNLLPLSIKELASHHSKTEHFQTYCLLGFMPRVHVKNIRPTTFYKNYYSTYVEKDVRQLINLKDLSLFEKFMKLLAGRIGQIMDYSNLANDVGVSAKTIKNWLSILEASYLVFKLPPYYKNFGKRAIKSPKYYFTDVGLLSFLLGIETEEQIIRDPLVGSIFENLVIINLLKTCYNSGQSAGLYFYRESNGLEIDLIYQKGKNLIPIEIKSSSTYSSALVKNLKKIQDIIPDISPGYLVYNGDSRPGPEGITLSNFKELLII